MGVSSVPMRSPRRFPRSWDGDLVLAAAYTASVVGSRYQIKPNPPPPPPSSSLLRAALERAQQAETLGRCGICGEPIYKRFKHPHRLSMSVDHKVPLARGGTDVLSNLQLAHLGCNSRKQDRLPGELPLAQALRCSSI